VRLQISALFRALLRHERPSGVQIHFIVLFMALCLFAPQLAPGQDSERLSGPASSDHTAASTNVPPSTEAALTAPPTSGPRGSPESEIVVEGLASYGHYRIFASGTGCHLYTAGLEYDRHSWGRFLGARLDYVAEVLPLILLDTATTSNIWGNPTTTSRTIVPGVGVSPIGFRMLWLDRKAWKPYLIAKGGMLSFTQKELSNKSTYENFSLQSGVGLQVRMNERIDLRLGLFSDFHFSNAFIAPVDPGLDVMSANVGVSYHLGQVSSRLGR
jgi:hypothetical protein